MKTTKYKIILSTSLLCYSSLSFAFTVTYINSCNYPIWLKDHKQEAPTVNRKDPLYPNDKYTVEYGKSINSYMMWVAAGCNTDGANCKIGNGPGRDTLFEFTIPGIYDISAVDGYTFPMLVKVPLDRQRNACQNIDATGLDVTKCPEKDDLSWIGPSGIPFTTEGRDKDGNKIYIYDRTAFKPLITYDNNGMVNLHQVPGVPAQTLPLRDNNGTGPILACQSPRTVSLDQANPYVKDKNPDVAAWYSCSGMLAELAHECGLGPNHTTNYYKTIRQAASRVYAFPYDDSLNGVGNNQCEPDTNYTVIIGNPDNANACPNIGQVTPPPPTATCQPPELVTFNTTKLKPDGSAITINWATPSGSTVTGYRVFNYNQQPIGGDGNHIIYTSSYTDNTTPILTIGQQSVPYVYKIQSVCVNGDSKAITTYATPRLTGEAEAICPTPNKNSFTVTKNKADGSSIAIDWPDVAGNVTGYNIFNWHGDFIGSTSTSSYIDNTTPSLAPGQQSVPYQYQVQSVCGSNKSKISDTYSAIVTGEALKCVAPDIATFSLISKDHGSRIKISWATPSGKNIVGYKVFDWGMKPLKDGDVPTSSYENQIQYSLPNLARNQVANYWYYVQSKCSDGTTSDMSQKYIATVIGN